MPLFFPHHQTDPHIDLVLHLLRELKQEIRIMSGQVETVGTQVTALQGNMLSLHNAAADIQARLAAAIAGAGSGDPNAVTDLQAINADLVAVVAALAPTMPPAA